MDNLMITRALQRLWLDQDLKAFWETSNFWAAQKIKKNDKGYKVRSFINHFNQSFSNSASNDDSQSIDEHMVKFNQA